LNNFVNTTVPAITLQADKEDAVNQLQQTLAATKTAIEGDRTLSPAQETAQSQAAQSAYDQAVDAVNGATTVMAVGQELSTETTNIQKAHQSQGTLADQLPALNKQVDNSGQAAIDTINQDNTLSQVEKQKQIAAVKDQIEKTKQAIASSADPRAADAALAAGQDAINQVHQPGLDLSEQIKRAIKQTHVAADEAY
ncbi:DUF1542 domain-containing protein, partial [Fructobacillus ficulneus]|uniref:DUF1542 domain-containing protein n=1 Tax=Fructobacillus ficulneus TaxID=157463 RepID=UPI000A6A734B